MIEFFAFIGLLATVHGAYRGVKWYKANMGNAGMGADGSGSDDNDKLVK